MVIMVRIAGIKPLKFLSFPSQLTVNGEFKQAQYQYCLSNDQNIALSHIHRGIQELPSGWEALQQVDL